MLFFQPVRTCTFVRTGSSTGVRSRPGEAFETTISIHPAERYTFSMVLKRSAAAQKSG